METNGARLSNGNAHLQVPGVVTTSARQRSASVVSEQGLGARLRCGFSSSDFSSILLLTFLYLLQQVPVGMTKAVPYLLQSRKAGYHAQGTFSFTIWPFSLKLLWAPLVDSLSWARFGRRKTWIVPAQFMISLTMFFISLNISTWLGDYEPSLNSIENSTTLSYNKTLIETAESAGSSVHIIKMSAAFFVLNFLAATQDIVVDGWAVGMLSRKNVGWAATCNTVGQSAGIFFAFFLFISLESADFCNKWLRSVPNAVGLVTFPSFLIFWAIVYAITTTMVMFFKTELPSTSSSADSSVEQNTLSLMGELEIKPSVYAVTEMVIDEERVEADGAELGPLDTYKTLWKIIMLRPIQIFILILFLVKFTFTAADQISELQLIDRGVPKENLALLQVFLFPLNIVMLLAVSRYSTGPRPLTVFFNSAWPRLFLSLVFALMVYMTPSFRLTNGSYPLYYFVILLIMNGVYQTFVCSMKACQWSFHAKVSDPTIGATYMTLLDTVSNIADMLPNTILLYFMSIITQKACRGGSSDGISCYTEAGADTCVKNGGACYIWLNGYYIEIAFCTLVGISSILVMRSHGLRLQSLEPSAWAVTKKKTLRRNKSSTNGFP